MIVDITNELITDIKKELPNIEVLSPHQYVTPKFPTITVEEDSNTGDVSTKDSSGFTHVNVSYSIEIFTEGNKKVSQAKDIRNRINDVISSGYGLTRGFSGPIPNYLDGSIYRYKMTYTGKINKNKTIYRG